MRCFHIKMKNLCSHLTYEQVFISHRVITFKFLIVDAYMLLRKSFKILSFNWKIFYNITKSIKNPNLFEEFFNMALVDIIPWYYTIMILYQLMLYHLYILWYLVFANTSTKIITNRSRICYVLVWILVNSVVKYLTFCIQDLSKFDVQVHYIKQLLYRNLESQFTYSPLKNKAYHSY